MIIRAVVTLVLVGSAAGVCYAQAPVTTVEEVKATGAIALFESPETAGRCLVEIEREKATIQAWEDYQRERAALVEQRDPGKPTKDMTPDERAAWQKRKVAAELALADLEAKHPDFAQKGGVMRLAEAATARERTCSEAMMAQLAEGTVLSVLKREKLLRVRVETGRSAGRVGFVFPADVKGEK